MTATIFSVFVLLLIIRMPVSFSWPYRRQSPLSLPGAWIP